MRKLVMATILVCGFASLAYATAYKTGWTNPQNVVERASAYVFGVPQTPKIVAASTTSARTATDFTLNAIVKILCRTDAFYKLGDATVVASEATSDFWPANTPDWINVGTNTRIAWVTETGTGDCYNTEILDP